MAKMTYAEQLKHPNWQRKRLEMLNAANFSCGACGDKETTLHVHHKRYIKGRMAWEYDCTELVVLCEECHDCAHQEADLSDKILASVDVLMTPAVNGILAGYLDGSCDGDAGYNHMAREGSPRTYLHGLLASMLYTCSMSELKQIFRTVAAKECAEIPAIRSMLEAFDAEEEAQK